MKKILVTGVSGFLGGYLRGYFEGQGFLVTGIDRQHPQRKPSAKIVVCEVGSTDFESLLKDFQPEAIIHAAGGASVQASVEDPGADFAAGPLLTSRVLESTRRWAPGAKFVFLSSAAVYGQPETLPVNGSTPCQPISPYGYHKRMCELLCEEYSKSFGLQTAAVRIFSAYGNGLKKQVVWDLCGRVESRMTLRVQGTGSESRDFIHVEDICGAIACILKNAPMQGEKFNLASGVETSVGVLVSWILEECKGAGPVEFDGIVPAGVPRNWRADISQLRALGWTPIKKNETGLRDFIRWCLVEQGKSEG